MWTDHECGAETPTDGHCSDVESGRKVPRKDGGGNLDEDVAEEESGVVLQVS
jgi:hypothetical protein